jgi:hypothetical protein
MCRFVMYLVFFHDCSFDQGSHQDLVAAGENCTHLLRKPDAPDIAAAANDDATGAAAAIVSRSLLSEIIQFQAVLDFIVAVILTVLVGILFGK